MKHYLIRQCDGSWDLAVDGQKDPMFTSEDRDALVTLASKTAAAHDGIVSVYTQTHDLLFEVRYTNGTAMVTTGASAG